MHRDSSLAFYLSKLKELESLSSLIEALTNHPTTVGTFRERILINYIRCFVPPMFKVKTGFIGGFNGNETSKQIDVIIYEALTSVPYYENDDFVIVRPESVVAALEVKSTLTLYQSKDSGNYEGTLMDAFANIKSASDACGNIAGYFYGVICFDHNFKAQNIYDALDSSAPQKQLGVTSIVDVPKIICDINRFCACITHEDIFDGTSGDSSLSYFALLSNDGHMDKDSSKVFPLRFFTVFLLNFIKSKMSSSPQFDELGIHSIGKNDSGGGVKLSTFDHHFDLDSSKMEGQNVHSFRIKTSSS